MINTIIKVAPQTKQMNSAANPAVFKKASPAPSPALGCKALVSEKYPLGQGRHSPALMLYVPNSHGEHPIPLNTCPIAQDLHSFDSFESV